MKLTTVSAPTPQVSKTPVTRSDAPKPLVYNRGAQDMRWERKAFVDGTRLTLECNIVDRRFISRGADGWPICCDVLDHFLEWNSHRPHPRWPGDGFGGWQQLNAEYAKQRGVETPNWPSQAAQES